MRITVSYLVGHGDFFIKRYNYIGTMKKERILVLDLLKKHLEKAGK